MPCLSWPRARAGRRARSVSGPEDLGQVAVIAHVRAVVDAQHVIRRDIDVTVLSVEGRAVVSTGDRISVEEVVLRRAIGTVVRKNTKPFVSGASVAVMLLEATRIRWQPSSLMAAALSVAPEPGLELYPLSLMVFETTQPASASVTSIQLLPPAPP